MTPLDSLRFGRRTAYFIWKSNQSLQTQSQILRTLRSPLPFRTRACQFTIHYYINTAKFPTDYIAQFSYLAPGLYTLRTYDPRSHSLSPPNQWKLSSASVYYHHNCHNLQLAQYWWMTQLPHGHICAHCRYVKWIITYLLGTLRRWNWISVGQSGWDICKFWRYGSCMCCRESGNVISG